MIRRPPAARRSAFSLMEMLAVVTILGVLAALIVPRFTGQAKAARKNACDVNRGNIEVQCQLWYRNKGAWPAAALSDIGADPKYFPDRIPACPVDSTAYTIDRSTGRVVGHSH
ncbi:MAG: prepilin-type N-terminal cleavage/methylation domain-containing protein [Planctomycetes bacterium]|nr:prepilin-type N-terminal cleavage/methylation domain-containing protein [Planctomycetota bacterium]